MRFSALLRTAWAGSWRPGRVFWWELLIMRTVFAGVVWRWMPRSLGFPDQPHPIGLARMMDLTWLSEHYGWVRPALAGLLVAYAAGLGLPVVLPLLAFLHIGIYTLYNSQGFVTHSIQVTDQVLLAQALVAVFFGFWRLCTGKPFAFRGGATRDSFILYFSQGVILLSYFTSACSKLLRSEGRWLQDLPNMPLGLLRTRLQAYYSDPSGIPPDAPPLTDWLIANPTAAIWMFAPGFFIELLAVLGLRNRLYALVAGLALIALHESISLVMRLDFILNEWCVLIFLVNLPWWLWWACYGCRQTTATPEHKPLAPPGGSI
jgi:hypothetical protein